MKVLILKYENEYICAMGDTIDCVSLVNQLAAKEPQGRLIFPVQHGYMDNVRSFFPIDTPIEFVNLLNFNTYDELKKSRGAIEFITYGTATDHNDIRALYRAAGLNYAEREKYCTIRNQVKRIPQIEPPTEPYAFIPEGGSPKLNGGTGYTCDRRFKDKGLIEIVPPQNAMMLAYAKIIEHATEIHCHPTSWQRLIDKLPTTGKLFHHLYARKINMRPDEIVYNKEWKQLIEPFEMEKQIITAPVKEKAPAPNVATVQKPKQQVKEKQNANK